MLYFRLLLGVRRRGQKGTLLIVFENFVCKTRPITHEGLR